MSSSFELRLEAYDDALKSVLTQLVKNYLDDTMGKKVVLDRIEIAITRWSQLVSEVNSHDRARD